jgi:hypothetical protein
VETPSGSRRTPRNHFLRFLAYFLGAQLERRELIWSGESDTMLEKSFEKMGKGYAQSLYNQLRKDKVIPKK